MCLAAPKRNLGNYNNREDLNLIIKKITEKTKEVREEIYRLLLDEFKYFE
jgi:hypothetical protein